MSALDPSPAAPGPLRDLRRLQYGLALGLVAVPLAFVLYQAFIAPSVAFLHGGSERAAWITRPHHPSLVAVVVDPTDAVPLQFYKTFELDRVPEAGVTLHVRTLDRVEVSVNSIRIPDSEIATSGPRKAGRVEIARHLRAGDNEIRVQVWNALGPRLLHLWLEGVPVPVATDSSWNVVTPGRPPVAAMIADDTVANPQSLGMSTPREAFSRKYGVLAMLFVGSCCFFLLARRSLGEAQRRCIPVVTATGLSVAWVWLFFAKTVPTPIEFGFDSLGHLEYIDYILTNGELPRPGKAWSTFHPPLFYVLAAGLEYAGSVFSDGANRDLLLRVVPLLSGIGIIWVTVPFSRRVFGDDPLRVTLATLAAGTLPMNLCVSTYVSNESLHAFFATVALWLTFVALDDARTRPRVVALVGVAFGLALLSKFTSIVALGLAGAFLLWKLCAVERRPVTNALAVGFWFAVGPVALAGWYYAANIAEFGTPLVANWAGIEDRAWWQHPGFHTPAYFLSFGESFRHPDLSGFRSFWDGLYTTLWGDGLISGRTTITSRNLQLWNFDFMALTYPIALPATAMMFLGLWRLASCAWQEASATRQLALLFLLCTLAFMACALLYFPLMLPAYSATKSIYALFLVAPIAMGFAEGFTALDRRLQASKLAIGRVVLYGWLGSFFAVSFLAFAG